MAISHNFNLGTNHIPDIEVVGASIDKVKVQFHAG
jgi:hypothetical protein